MRLLADIRQVFDTCGRDRLATSALFAALSADDEAPWGDLVHGTPIRARARRESEALRDPLAHRSHG